jgi:hypothetical protein
MVGCSFRSDKPRLVAIFFSYVNTGWFLLVGLMMAKTTAGDPFDGCRMVKLEDST